MDRERTVEELQDAVPDAVAESAREPRSRSAWVTVAVAVNVAD